MARGTRKLEQDTNFNAFRSYGPAVPAVPLDMPAVRDLTPTYADVAHAEADTLVRNIACKVETFDDFFAWAPNDLSARDGLTVLYGPGVAAAPDPTVVPGRWHRIGVPSPRNKAQALSYSGAARTGGLAVDPVSGNDENLGSPAAPLKTANELVRRLRGLNFGSGIPTVQLLSDGTDDYNFRGFDCQQLTVVNVGTVAGGGGGLTVAAVVHHSASAAATVTVTSFNFSSFVSSTSKTYWLRRTNGDGTFIYASIWGAPSLGVANISKEMRLDTASGVAAAGGANLFQVSDTLDIVTFPGVGGAIANLEAAASLRVVGVDITAIKTYIGPSTWGLTGARAAAIWSGVGLFSGLQATAGGQFQGSASAAFRGLVVGALGASTASFTTGGGNLLQNFIFQNASWGITGGGDVSSMDVGWVQNSASPISIGAARVQALSAIGGASNGTGVTIGNGAGAGGEIRACNGLVAFFASCTTQVVMDGVAETPVVGGSAHTIRHEDTGSAAYP